MDLRLLPRHNFLLRKDRRPKGGESPRAQRGDMPTYRVERDVMSDVLANVLTTMTGTDVSPGKGVVEGGSVAVVVGLSGPQLRIAVILQLGREAARGLAAAMLQDPALPWGSEAEDAVAELTNMVAGNLKPHIAPGLTMALPTVIKGEDLRVSTSRMSEMQVEVFECLGQPLVLILAREH